MTAIARQPEDQQPTNSRLHVSPLNPDILAGLLNDHSSSQDVALLSRVSYHSVESEPEKGTYGFIEVDAETADQIRKKFNGKIFRGARMSINPARADRLQKARADQLEADAERQATQKAQGEDGEGGREAGKSESTGQQELVRGVELQNRRVKRGWTQSAAEIHAAKRARKTERKDGKPAVNAFSKKGGEKRECLFKQRMPAETREVAVSAGAMVEGNEAGGSSKKRKRERKGKGKGVVTVKEFEKSSKFPTFLKQKAVDRGQSSAEYVDGEGWLDEDGTVVEGPRQSSRPDSRRRNSQTPAEYAHNHPDADSSNESDGGTAPGLPSPDQPALTTPVKSISPQELSPRHHHVKHPNLRISTPANLLPILPSVESSSLSPVRKPAISTKRSKQSTVSTRNQKSDVPTTSTGAHFFETTFKPKNPLSIPRSHPHLRNQTTSDPIPGSPNDTEPEPESEPLNSTFRFFAPDDDDDDDGDNIDNSQLQHDSRSLSVSLAPQTPGGLWRRERSTAPTPDTAALRPSSRPSWARSRDTSASADANTNTNTNAPPPDSEALQSGQARHWTRSQDHQRGARASRGGDRRAGPGGGGNVLKEMELEGKDFRDVFYELRGESNRAWKANRKEALKEKRRREERNWEGKVGLRRRGGGGGNGAGAGGGA